MGKQKNLTSLVKGTISGIEAHKDEIFEIYDHLRIEIEEVRKRITKTSDELKKRELNRAKLENEEQTLKRNLAEASKHYSEPEIERAYEKLVSIEKERTDAEASVERLMVEREQLITREHHLNNSHNKAEHYTFAIGAALTYLSQELEGISYELDDIEEKRKMGVKVIKAQEEERRRISRELHDGPLQELTATMYDTMVAEKLVNRDPEEAIENIQKLRRNLRQTTANIRQIIFDIRPMALDDQGLVSATEELLAKLKERNVLNTEFVCAGEEFKFPIHTQAAVFRIVQEALTNTARHAKVKDAKVIMRFTDDTLEVLAEDKGKGFDVKTISKEQQDREDHFGIISMKERAELIGAKIKITSEPGKGTKINLVVPYREQKEEML